MKVNRKVMYKIRKRALQAMTDLTFILHGIRKVSGHPERDFAIIFQNEDVYFELLRALDSAYEESFKVNRMLFNDVNRPVIQEALSRGGLGYYTVRQLADRHVRNEVLERLKNLKTPDGRLYFEEVQEEIITRKPCLLVRARDEVERSKKLLAIRRWKPQDDHPVNNC